MRRFPLEPLLEQLREPNEHAVCARLGIGGQTLKRFRVEGLSEVQADRYASKAGFHAASVWPDWFDQGEVVSVVRHECPVCGRAQREVDRLPVATDEHGATVQFGAVVSCAEGHLYDLVVSLLPHVPSGEEGPSSPLVAAGRVAE